MSYLILRASLTQIRYVTRSSMHIYLDIDFFITGLCTGRYFLWDRCITALKMRCFLKLISKLMGVISKCGFDHRSDRFILHCVFLVLYILMEAEAAHGRCFLCLSGKEGHAVKLKNTWFDRLQIFSTIADDALTAHHSSNMP